MALVWSDLKEDFLEALALPQTLNNTEPVAGHQVISSDTWEREKNNLRPSCSITSSVAN